VAIAVLVPVAVAAVAVVALRHANPQQRVGSPSERPLMSILGVLRGPRTAPDRVFRNGGSFNWNFLYLTPRTNPRVRYGTTAPWGDRLFVVAPPADSTTADGVVVGPQAFPNRALSLEGELVGLPRHPLISHGSGGLLPVPDPYIPLTTDAVEAGRATYIWPGGQPQMPSSGSSIEGLFGPSEEIAVVVPDGVTKVEFVLPRQPMAIVGAPVYPRVEHLTVPVHHNVAVAEIDRTCCYLPAAQIKRLVLDSSETQQPSGPMIWFGADGQVVKRIGDFAAAGRVLPLPTPGPETAASRAAERDLSTPNHVWITPTSGTARTQFHVHFKALLTGAIYDYQLLRLTGQPCQIRGYGGGQTVHQSIPGISADYQPNVVRGSTWDGLLSLNSEGTTPLCPGTYRLSVSVLDRGIFGEYGARGLGHLRKPFGSTTFTIR
jgi:hypothetical protein